MYRSKYLQKSKKIGERLGDCDIQLHSLTAPETHCRKKLKSNIVRVLAALALAISEHNLTYTTDLCFKVKFDTKVKV